MDKYTLLRKIGEGTFGEVLQAEHNETKEIVAIKKFKGSNDDESTAELNKREVKILKRLQGQPNIIQLKDVFDDDEHLCLVFEFMSGGCLLSELQRRPGGFAPDVIQSYTYQMIKALKSCHDINVGHRDIKPENLLLSNDRKVLKLCDFGCARKMKMRLNLTDYIATRWYRAPELLLGTHDYTLAVDIWAVGCIVVEMVDGRPLIPCKDGIEGLGQIQRIIGLHDALKKELKESGGALADAASIPHLPDELVSRCGHKLNKLALSFLKGLLHTDPAKRLTADQALNHEYMRPLSITPTGTLAKSNSSKGSFTKATKSPSHKKPEPEKVGRKPLQEIQPQPAPLDQNNSLASEYEADFEAIEICEGDDSLSPPVKKHDEDHSEPSKKPAMMMPHKPAHPQKKRSKKPFDPNEEISVRNMKPPPPSILDISQSSSSGDGLGVNEAPSSTSELARAVLPLITKGPYPPPAAPTANELTPKASHAPHPHHPHRGKASANTVLDSDAQLGGAQKAHHPLKKFVTPKRHRRIIGNTNSSTNDRYRANNHNQNSRDDDDANSDNEENNKHAPALGSNSMELIGHSFSSQNNITPRHRGGANPTTHQRFPIVESSPGGGGGSFLPPPLHPTLPSKKHSTHARPGALPTANSKIVANNNNVGASPLRQNMLQPSSSGISGGGGNSALTGPLPAIKGRMAGNRVMNTNARRTSDIEL